MEYAVECRDLVKSFGPDTVLDNLSIKIPKGKITTILGFSGAGKSTFLKHILGLLKPTSGEMFVLGERLLDLSDYELRDFRTNFGMLFQYAALFDSLSAFKNIEFALREFTKLSKQGREDRVIELFDAVGLERQALHKLPSELSGGMRKRVGLARALALRPKIMLYDEPTTGLDPITTKMVNDLILKTSKDNSDIELTSIVISHDVEASLRISDYVAFLERGRIIEYLPVDEFRKSKNDKIRKFLDL
jgi:phospholipid/cholesterol/gamma-HCH transport system ATP-binding protein